MPKPFMRMNLPRLTLPTLLCIFPIAWAQAPGTNGGGSAVVAPYQPLWVRSQIIAFEARQGPPASAVLRKVQFKGKPAFFIPSPCCDLFNYLYDAEGNPLCAPTGGLGGRGDGQCPNALSQPS